MKTFGVLLWLTLAAPIVLPAQEGPDRVIAEALKPSPLETNLQNLTDQIGGRVPGTPQMQKAVDWGIAAFKAAGADSVHTEDFKIPASWAEGDTRLNVSAPESFSLRLVSLAWAPALASQHHVRVVDIGGGSPEDFAKAGDIRGTLLLVHSSEMATWDDLFAEYLRAPGIIDRAVKGKALAIAFQSTRPHDLLYRHTNSLAGNIDRLPMVLVAREDAARVARLIASGQKVYADLSIPNRIGGPITATNVVAELRGSEKPNEFVVLGAHLDSWELGTGALDNGCNAALVIDALRAIKATGLQPKRSIRFILFSGEEKGLLGSHAYVRAHRAELDKAAGVVILDEGSGQVTGFSLGGRKDIVPAVTALVAPLKQFGATTLTTDAEWGTDHFDFMLEGVPTLFANQVEANYLINYHAMSDTYDKVDLPQLKKHVAEAAVVTFGIADAQAGIGPRLHRAQIEQTMRETHLDDLMKHLACGTIGSRARWGERTNFDLRQRESVCVGSSVSQVLFWVLFNLFVVAMLGIDLWVLHRPAHTVKFREALLWSVQWIGLAAVFAVLVFFWQGRASAVEFTTGYIIELSLSVDNLFIFLVIFKYFKVPSDHQHKVLFWGILGALIMRGIFIVVGVQLIQAFHWITYLFGAFLVYSGVRLFREDEVAVEPEKNPVLRLFRRSMPITEDYEGDKFFVRRAGLYATPLLVVLLVVETTDLLFATDSIPAVLAITLKPFIVYTSNVFAILGLRAMYFVLAGMMETFHYLHYGLSIVLIFVGAKMIAADFYTMPTEIALVVVIGVIGISVLASVLKPKKQTS